MDTLLNNVSPNGFTIMVFITLGGEVSVIITLSRDLLVNRCVNHVASKKIPLKILKGVFAVFFKCNAKNVYLKL